MFSFIQKISVFILLGIFPNLVLSNSVLPKNKAFDHSRSITVAVLQDFPPLYSLNNKRNPQGFAIDLVEFIAKQADLNINYLVVENWAEAMAAVRTGKADLIPGIGISPPRKAEFLFTKVMETVPVSCFIRDSNYTISGVKSLINKKVAVIAKSAAESQLKKMNIGKLVGFKNIESALFKLMSGEVDAFVFPEPVLNVVVNLKLTYLIEN